MSVKIFHLAHTQAYAVHTVQPSITLTYKLNNDTNSTLLSLKFLLPKSRLLCQSTDNISIEQYCIPIKDNKHT